VVEVLDVQVPAVEEEVHELFYVVFQEVVVGVVQVAPLLLD